MRDAWMRVAPLVYRLGNLQCPEILVGKRAWQARPPPLLCLDLKESQTLYLL